MTTGDSPLADARRLLGSRDRPEPGCCVWCGARLPQGPDPREEGGWPVHRRYCGERCRETAAGAKRRGDGAGPVVVLLALVLAGQPQTLDESGALVAARDVPEELAQAARRCRKAAGQAVTAARVQAAFDGLARSSAGPWLACSECGRATLGRRTVTGKLDRTRLGARCRLTAGCGGALVVVLDRLGREGGAIAA